MGNKLFGIINRRTLDVPEKSTSRIKNDPYLNFLYTSELRLVLAAGQTSPISKIVEIGGAGGNTKDLYPNIITTDVRPANGIDLVMQAESIEFENDSLDLIFGLDAFHHVRDPEKHLFEVARTLKVGGNAIYIEPNWNLFSKFCFKYLLKYLHPEPYDTSHQGWKLTDPDPMMGNQCQAYNIFVRDRILFNEKFPNLSVEFLEPIKGLAFLLSGGVHTRLPVPGKLLIKMSKLENSNPRWINWVGLGRIIKITKIEVM